MKKKLFLFTAMIAATIIVVVSCQQKEEKKEAAAAAPGNDELVKRGAYLVSVAGCDDCHTPKKMGPNGPEPDMERRLSGFRAGTDLPHVDTNVVKGGWILTNNELTGWVGPWGASFTANITSDETGIGNWSEEQFEKAIRKGKWKGMDGNRSLLPPMPWQDFAHFTDEDVKAIYLFLKSTTPIKNVEPSIRGLADLK